MSTSQPRRLGGRFTKRVINGGDEESSPEPAPLEEPEPVTEPEPAIAAALEPYRQLAGQLRSAFDRVTELGQTIASVQMTGQQTAQSYQSLLENAVADDEAAIAGIAKLDARGRVHQHKLAILEKQVAQAHSALRSCTGSFSRSFNALGITLEGLQLDRATQQILSMIHPGHLIAAKPYARDVATMTEHAVQTRSLQMRPFTMINEASAPEAVYPETGRVLKMVEPLLQAATSWIKKGFIPPPVWTAQDQQAALVSLAELRQPASIAKISKKAETRCSQSLSKLMKAGVPVLRTNT